MYDSTPFETNPLPEGFHKEYTDKIEEDVAWTEPGLEIVRCRFLSNVGYPAWDLSYCIGRIKVTAPDTLSGWRYMIVQVWPPFYQLEKYTDGSRKHKNRINTQLVKLAREDGVHAKNMGLLDHISTFNV
jgi:hypothetical protein